jgi:electron transfer flavoprotein beta subunit
LELKESPNSAVEKVTVITVGLQDAEATIRKALAIGADDAIRINAEPVDAYFVAMQIAEVVKIDMYDIILCGIESSDYNGSMVGGMLAEFLNIPSVSAVSALNIKGEDITLDREIDGGKEIISISSPFVAIVQKGISIEPRIASMRGIIMAKKKPLSIVQPVEAEALTENIEFELPEPKAACKMISPDNVKELIELLKNEAKVI